MENEKSTTEQSYEDFAYGLMLGILNRLEESGTTEDGILTDELFCSEILEETRGIKVTSYTPDNLEKAKAFVHEKIRETIPDNNGALEIRTVKILRDVAACVHGYNTAKGKDKDQWARVFVKLLDTNLIERNNEFLREIIPTEDESLVKTLDQILKDGGTQKNSERKLSRRELRYCLDFVSRISNSYIK